MFEFIKNWLYILRFVLIVYGVYVIVRIVIDSLAASKAKEAHIQTIHYLRTRLGHNIGVQGPIRVGKNSVASGLVHDCTNIVLSKILEVRNTFKEICYWVDFHVIDDQIYNIHTMYELPKKEEDYFEEFLKTRLNSNDFQSVSDLNEVMQEEFYNYCEDKKVKKYNLYEIFNALNNTYGHLFDGSTGNPSTYNNHLETKKLSDMFLEYVIASCRLIDNNFVMSNYNLYSRITNNYAVECSLDDFAIKDKYLVHKFRFIPYSVVVIDEALISDFVNTNWQSTAKSDPGIDTFLRLTGNMFSETVYFIFIGQNLGRLNKSIRELFTTHISLFGHVKMADKPYYNKWIHNFQKINYLFMNFVALFHFKKKEAYLDRDNVFKRINLKLLDLYNLNISESYLCFESIFYYREEDVGKSPSPDNKFINDFNIVSPTLFCWGTYDTHFYKFALKELLENVYLSKKVDVDDFYKYYYLNQRKMQKGYASTSANELEGKRIFKQLISKRNSTIKDDTIAEKQEDITY